MGLVLLGFLVLWRGSHAGGPRGMPGGSDRPDISDGLKTAMSTTVVPPERGADSGRENASG